MPLLLVDLTREQVGEERVARVGKPRVREHRVEGRPLVVGGSGGGSCVAAVVCPVCCVASNNKSLFEVGYISSVVPDG